MTQEEFRLQKRIIREQRNALVDEELRIKEQYIESNKEFDILDKVKVIHSDGSCEFGFIKHISISYSDLLEYTVNRAKKDGTMSLIKLWIKDSDKIEKI